MDADALSAELAAVVDGDLPYDVDAAAYRSTWDGADRSDRERVSAVSPALCRALDDYTAALHGLNAVRDTISDRGDTLAWALDIVEEHPGHPYRDDGDGYRFVLSTHPTRDRTVVYEDVGRCVERFADGFQEAIGPDALRSRVLGKSMGRDWSYRHHLRRWDEEHEGWEEVLWAWRDAADVPALLDERDRYREEAADAAADALDRLDDRSISAFL